MSEFGQYSAIVVSMADAPVCRIVLNRPDKRNALGPRTVGELISAFEIAGAREDVRVVVLAAAGKCFSAGGDLSQMRGTVQDDVGGGSFVDLFKTMHGLGKPIIAMVGGHALAGGLGLVVACDMAIAATHATFGTTEIRVGLWPMMITAEITRNIGRKRTLELMLTGDRIDAAEAASIGLINRTVPSQHLEAETMSLALSIADNSPATTALGLRAFYDAQDMPFGEALAFLQNELGKVLSLDDAREGLAAFFEKRPPVWRGR